MLVVEDEAAVRQLVRRSLEAVGLTVLEAENGQQALEVVSRRRERPKLVLTDVIMPGLNGRELSERLATTQPGLPMLFMSGYTDDDVLARSLLPDEAPFIQKPFGPEELVAKVTDDAGAVGAALHPERSEGPGRRSSGHSPRKIPRFARDDLLGSVTSRAPAVDFEPLRSPRPAAILPGHTRPDPV